jgi:Fic family protein
VPVRILGSAHTPPQPYAVAAKMEQLLAEYETQKTQSNIIEKIAEFHLRFEGIHPFIDGNGRTGRLIMNLELLKHGYLPIDIKYADKQRYYDCFDEYCSGANSAKAMVDLITEYEIAELKNRIAIIESIN